ncbi:hypothetical protein ASG40_19385 [Methylobacterium sp. Leaf399]|uniref:phage tail terminator-like protein n=1 Tax=Methylobacterium sp. Leaf399 TaxID=1736364 RepID=UPI0006FD5721|nr:phage tail terminator-like protein [Methylobacterium sp. Leaf399]KQT13992.1 hypothetical protein ASG40_19385 [Methylobacterium sp. Leaf399]
MALSAVSAAVEARLAGGWDKCPIRTLNDLAGDTPLDDEPFIELQFPVSQSEQISTGSPGTNVYRDEGVIRFVLNEVRGQGMVRALAWVDELAALFRGKYFDGVRSYAPSQPVLDDRNDDGRYFRLSFAVPYEHDTLG